MQSLCRDSGKAGICVTENKKRIGLYFIHKLIGAVDNVFTAKIGRILETKYDANEMPITIYEIEVLENIKGKLPTNIKIQLHQMGGIRKDNKNYVFFENTNLLEKDEEYLRFLYHY